MSISGAALANVDMCAGDTMRVVDRDALVHVGEVVLLEAELAVPVQDEVDRLAVVLGGQLLELEQRLVERMVVVELHGTVQRDGLREGRCGRRKPGDNAGSATERGSGLA